MPKARPLKPAERSSKRKDNRDADEYCEKTEISDWENEGGAEPQSPRGIGRV